MNLRRIFAIFALATLSASPLLARAGSISEDSFEVKKVDAKEATVEGTPKALKAGDFLYFARSPFQFQVTAVKGNQVTVALPEKNDLVAGQFLLRAPTPSIRKSIDTEKRLKQALEE